MLSQASGNHSRAIVSRRVFLAIIATAAHVIDALSAFSRVELLNALLERYVDTDSYLCYGEKVHTGFDFIRMLARFARGAAATSTTVMEFAFAVHWPGTSESYKSNISMLSSYMGLLRAAVLAPRR